MQLPIQEASPPSTASQCTKGLPADATNQGHPFSGGLLHAPFSSFPRTLCISSVLTTAPTRSHPDRSTSAGSALQICTRPRNFGLSSSCLELISWSCHVEAFGDEDQPRNKLVEPEPFKNVKSLSITINKAEFVSSHMAYWHLPNPRESLFTSSPFAEHSGAC